MQVDADTLHCQQQAEPRVCDERQAALAASRCDRLRNADSVVAQTKAAAEWMNEKFGLRCDVIPNALRELAPPVAPRKKTIVCVGRLDEHKGHDTLIRAFDIIRKTHREWRFVIVGDGSMRKSLEALCIELNIRGFVDFPGVSSIVEAWMESAGIFVLPSRFEGFPNVLIEAMAMGAAVISADCPHGPSEIIADNQDGRLVPVGDVEQLAASIADLIELRRSGKNWAPRRSGCEPATIKTPSWLCGRASCWPAGASALHE